MRFTTLMIALAIVAATLTGCETEDTMDEMANVAAAQPENPIGTVLISMKKSDFKSAVANEVELQLLASGYAVVREETDDLVQDAVTEPHEESGVSGLKSLNLYDAVIMLEAARGSVFRRDARKLYDVMKGDERLVVLLTTKKSQTDWEPEMEGLDAVTAASNMADVKTVADKIVQKTMAALGE